jgi:uncharacterized surface protein with fasciclin (FAS1) repeats
MTQKEGFMQNNKTTTVALVSVFVLIIGGVGIYALTNGNDEPKNSGTETSQTTPTTPKETSTMNNKSIVTLATENSSLSTLATAVTKAELVETLNGTGPFTVFAPTNDAFAALPAGTLDTLLMPENKAQLQTILKYHVVAGKVMSSDLSNGQVVKTVQGNSLTVRIDGSKVMLEDATGAMTEVVTADVAASNSVVHVINKVVMPQQ